MGTVLIGLAAIGETVPVALAVPMAVLVVGTPIALPVRLVLEVARAR